MSKVIKDYYRTSFKFKNANEEIKSTVNNCLAKIPHVLDFTWSGDVVFIQHMRSAFSKIVKRLLACRIGRGDFLALKSGVNPDQVDWSSPVQKYLLDDLVFREICSFMAPPSGLQFKFKNSEIFFAYFDEKK